jgi:hypothetical protein
MARPIYRVISSGKFFNRLVIESGIKGTATPSQSQIKVTFELLYDDGEPTNIIESFSWNELEEVRRD